MKEFTKYVGLDVHKKTIEIVTADDGRDGEVRYYGTIAGNLAALDKAIEKLRPLPQNLWVKSVKK